MLPLIRLLNENRIRYLVIGGQAIRFEGMPRVTLDWDLFVPRHDAGNLRRLNETLAEHLDTPVEALGPRGENFIQTYQTQWGVVQFHLAPAGLADFDVVESRSLLHTAEDGTPVRCVSGEDLLAAKLAANRPQDQVDIEFLRRRQALGWPR
jgi:hypothetical protein